MTAPTIIIEEGREDARVATLHVGLAVNIQHVDSIPAGVGEVKRPIVDRVCEEHAVRRPSAGSGGDCFNLAEDLGLVAVLVALRVAARQRGSVEGRVAFAA